MNIYRNDLEPPLRIDLQTKVEGTLDEYEPVDLTTATAVRVIGVDNTNTLAIDRSVTLTSGQKLAGLVEMPWEAGDTDTVGTLKFEVEVMWPGNRPQTFRPQAAVKIVADRG